MTLINTYDPITKSYTATAAPLSGTGTPSPSGLPGQTPSLPDTQAPSSPILSYASALEAAVNLARQHRNASSLDLMAPYRGTVAASDFNSILGNLNTASDKTAQDLIKNATPAKPDIYTTTNDNGDVTGIDKSTGQIVWTQKGVGNKQNNSSSSGVLVKSGNLQYTKADYSDDASALETSRGADGWVDPTVYKQLYDAWIASPHNGKIADFVKTFPPADYVNPANDWLPVYLRPKKSAGTVDWNSVLGTTP